MSHHQARPLYTGDDAADVQDPGAERAGAGLQSERAVPGGRQVQRRPGDAAGTPARRQLPLHFSLQGAFTYCRNKHAYGSLDDETG